MRIGYPCINRSIGCRGDRKFRLGSWSDTRFEATVRDNLACLARILEWNRQQGILFFRITSDLIPFASHPVCTFPWQQHFRGELARIGEFVSASGIRISMHPDQFIILNAPEERIVRRSTTELAYHAELLDLMGLGTAAKIQLHIGGLYGDADGSIRRFIGVFRRLDPLIQRRLVVENDDTRFGAAECLRIHEETGIPVLLDVFHHSCRNQGEDTGEMLQAAGKTWTRSDGTMMVDYSSQHPGKRAGGHADHLDADDFRRFLRISRPHDMDIMLEIKDKEESALAAIAIARDDPRFVMR